MTNFYICLFLERSSSFGKNIIEKLLAQSLLGFPENLKSFYVCNSYPMVLESNALNYTSTLQFLFVSYIE